MVMVGCVGLDPPRTDVVYRGEATGTEYSSLFDGVSLGGWAMAGEGKFVAVDGNLSAVPSGSGIGLLWNTTPTPADFELRLEWRRTADDDNSGVFVRFPDPNSKGYMNTAWVGVNFGFEVQIDDAGQPDGAAMHRTGAIYNQPVQAFNLQPSLPVGEWNGYVIRVQGQTYTVELNGVQVTQFVFSGDPAVPDRGLPGTAAQPRFIGVQAHTGLVSFRNVGIRPL
jgi:hypothetical protein